VQKDGFQPFESSRLTAPRLTRSTIEPEPAAPIPFFGYRPAYSVGVGRHTNTQLLNLVDDQPTGEPLTHLGTEVERFTRQQHETVTAALTEFDTWTGRSTRFTELAPRWAQLARSVAIQYEPTRLIITALERLHQHRTRDATLADVALEATRINQPLAVEVFFTRNRRDDVLTADGDIDESVLADTTVYKSGIRF